MSILSMNNLHYIAIQKAASWGDNFTMVQACINEFHMVQADDTIDTPALAIAAAKHNGINPQLIELFEA